MPIFPSSLASQQERKIICLTPWGLWFSFPSSHVFWVFLLCASRCFLTKNILDKTLKVSAILIVCSDVFGKPKIAYPVILKAFAEKSKATEVEHFIVNIVPSLWTLHFTKKYYTDSMYQAFSLRIVSEFFAYIPLQRDYLYKKSRTPVLFG